MFGFFKSGSGKPACPTAPRPNGPPALAAKRPRLPEATPDRAELIRQAVAIHRCKQTVLDHLSDEQRAKLLVLAMRTLMNQGHEPEDGR